MTIINITDKQLFDYITCPAYYDMKYNKGIKTEEKVTMQKLLDKVTRYFFTNLLNKRICTMDELKRKWDKVCEQNKDFINSKRNLEGMNYIINFARWAANNNIVLADFESDYTIRVGDTSVKGTLGPVAALPGRKCELLSPRFSSREPEQNDIDKKLKYTLDCLAFKEAYNHSISAVKVIHHKNNKEFITNRTQLDYDRLTSTINGVANGIQAKAFYPRESVFCSNCDLKLYCKYWS